PQVLAFGGRWSRRFCTAAAGWSEAYRAANSQAPVTGGHYLVADDVRGPGRVAPGPFLDGAEPCRRYAGKLVEVDGSLFFMGFIHTTETSEFVGAVSDPIPVSVDGDGLLQLHPERAGAGAVT